jgi:hypothetical protein
MTTPLALPRPPPPPEAPAAPDARGDDSTRAAASILARLPEPSVLRKPVWAIVCGSGLAGLADILTDRVDVAYSEIEGFGEATGGYSPCGPSSRGTAQRVTLQSRVTRQHSLSAICPLPECRW